MNTTATDSITITEAHSLGLSKLCLRSEDAGYLVIQRHNDPIAILIPLTGKGFSVMKELGELYAKLPKKTKDEESRSTWSWRNEIRQLVYKWKRSKTTLQKGVQTSDG